MQTALVTGATGFIGRHLVAALIERGVQVKCWVRGSSRVDHLADRGAEIVRGDFFDRQRLTSAVTGADTVFHLAGLTHAITANELNRINGDVCGILADVCRHQPKPPVLLYVSSLSAAGPTGPHEPPRTEPQSPLPISKYGHSKRRGEIEIQRRAADLPCTILRPGIVFGPHDPGTLSMIEPIHQLGLHVVVGFRTPPVALIYVDDLVNLILLAADKGERMVGTPDGEYDERGYYFAADDSEFPTYWQLGRRWATALNRRAIVLPLVQWVGRGFAGACELTNRVRGRSSFLNLDKVREGTVASWACSAEKARKQLGFEPAQSIQDAIRQTANWYLHSLGLPADSPPHHPPHPSSVHGSR